MGETKGYLHGCPPAVGYLGVPDTRNCSRVVACGQVLMIICTKHAAVICCFLIADPSQQNLNEDYLELWPSQPFCRALLHTPFYPPAASFTPRPDPTEQYAPRCLKVAPRTTSDEPSCSFTDLRNELVRRASFIATTAAAVAPAPPPARRRHVFYPRPPAARVGAAGPPSRRGQDK